MDHGSATSEDEVPPRSVYKRPKGRQAKKLQDEAMVAGRHLDLREVGDQIRDDLRWRHLSSRQARHSRARLIEELVLFARFYAQPFLLGTFTEENDVGPLSTACSTTEWFTDRGARRTHPDSTGYPNDLGHVAGSSGQLLQNADVPPAVPGVDSLFDEYLELFIDWILPFVMINASIRAQAVAMMTPPGMTGAMTTKVRNQLSNGHGSVINQHLFAYLEAKRDAQAAIDGADRFTPTQEILLAFGATLYRLVDDVRMVSAQDADPIKRHLEVKFPGQTLQAPADPFPVRDSGFPHPIDPESTQRLAEDRSDLWIRPGDDETLQSHHIGEIEHSVERETPTAAEYLRTLRQHERTVSPAAFAVASRCLEVIGTFRGRRRREQWEAHVAAQLASETPMDREDRIALHDRVHDLIKTVVIETVKAHMRTNSTEPPV